MGAFVWDQRFVTGIDIVDHPVWIEVEDTGKGISPETQGRIFGPFFTTNPIGEGTGRGLFLSYDIVKRHGGHFDITSSQGRGTTFQLWLPTAGQTN